MRVEESGTQRGGCLERAPGGPGGALSTTQALFPNPTLGKSLQFRELSSQDLSLPVP